jgi:isopropylmalate/homocitrate/citramalate synthase
VTVDIGALQGRRITLVEVGPRDGLQNERAIVSTDDKVTFIDKLANAGCGVIEVSAFVRPTRVPQMADAADLFARLPRRPGVRYTALVPNLLGLEHAAAAGLHEIAIFAASSESFSRANINQGIEESFANYARVCAEAQARGMRVRAYLSTAFGCPYEGAIAPDVVAHLAGRLIAMGAFEVAVSDTIGIAHPAQVVAVVNAVRQQIAVEQIALHFHDTRGTALANVLAALTMGVTTFDSSAGGLGGCPYAPGASGNLATEDLVYMLDGLGVETGIELTRLTAASRFIESRLDHPLPSKYVQAMRSSA